MPKAPPAPWWRIILRQFINPLIFVLALAAALSLAIGHATDAGFIAAVIVLNGLIGGFQEWRAERSAQALQQLMKFCASVEREGEVREIDASEVVPGDIVWLESGFRVPADGRLLSETGLEIDESLLTGESLAVDKDASWLGESQTPLADRINMVHAGTTVVRGRGKAVVTATGANSNVGQLAIDVMAAPPGRPPLLERLDRFSRVIGIASIAAAALIAILGILVHGYTIADMAIFGVALAVSVIPEGLPVAITIALAVASRRMARRGVIVRRLGAVEGLGSCTLIATDKTGTLTCNELTAREIRLRSGTRLSVSGEGFAPHGEIAPSPRELSDADRTDLDQLAIVLVLCNEADLHQRDGDWTWRGDPTDVALLSMAHKTGLVPGREESLDEHPELNKIPFEPEHRFAASFHQFDGEIRVLVKGAPERVLAMCAADQAGDALQRAKTYAHDMAANGLRVLAFAESEVFGLLDPSMAPPPPQNLRFLGLVGMIDPLRAGAREAVSHCEQAGIGVCMVTGDHPTTALAIARDLGIAQQPDQVITGDAFDKLSDDEIRAALGGGTPTLRAGTPGSENRATVFARVAPHQKLRIVKAARDAGHFVAVTGDGANDAPALKAANIGVAMGRGGTDVARDASDLVISDDNFATIVRGVEQGRIAYDNIRKVIYLLLSTNGAEVFLFIAAVAIGLPLPLLPVQLLWLNLVTEGMQHVALAFEPGERDILKRKPRPPREPIFNRLMIARLLIGSLVMGGVSLAAFWWMLERG
jgi:magnesium-transporting ATPase (P-type)